jgi:hypothetical protein
MRRGLRPDMSAPPHRPTADPPGRSVVILGMHRSGTSVVTKVVNLLGLQLCREDDVYSAPDNPTGHWESASLVGFNDRLIDLLGGKPAAPPMLDDGWQRNPEVAGLRQEARAVFMRAHPVTPWVWKDPRTCLTLPFWRSVWESPPVAVFVHREPLEVWLSLRRRDGFGKAHSIALWERYVRTGLRAADGLPLVTVRFRKLMTDPVAAVLELAAQLARLGVPAPGDASEAARFVSAGQVANRQPGLCLAEDPDATDSQRSLLAAIDVLPGAAAHFAATDLGAESASTTELLDAIRERDHPTFRVAAREVLPAFRRTAGSRLQRRSGLSGAADRAG